MSPPRKTREQLLDERRKQIFSAAVKIFATRGFANTKISDIASAADLSHGLIYHYFKTKDEIFTELIRYAHNHFVGALDYANNYEASPLEKIRIFTEVVTPQDYSEVSAYYSNVVIQAHTSKGLPKAVKKIINQNISKHNELITSLIIQGQRLGEIVKGDPLKLAYAHYSMLCGMQVMHILIKDFQDDPISIIDPDTVIRTLKNPSYHDEMANPKKIKRRFGKIKITDKLVSIRFRESEKSDFKIIKLRMFEKTEKGREVFYIETEIEAGKKTISVIQVDNMIPLYTESWNSKQELISKTEYKEDSVTIDIPGHKFQKTIKLHGEYIDIHTLPILFQAFPFESNDKIKFLLIIDGSADGTIGAAAMEVQKIGEEKVHVPVGDYNCYRLKMTPSIVPEDNADIYSYYFWYTVDEPHYFIKYEDTEGKLMELVQFE